MAWRDVIGTLSSDDPTPSIDGNLTPQGQTLDGNITRQDGELDGSIGASATRNYNHLHHKPQINHVTLEGDKSFPELGVRTITSGEILDILNI